MRQVISFLNRDFDAQLVQTVSTINMRGWASIIIFIYHAKLVRNV